MTELPWWPVAPKIARTLDMLVMFLVRVLMSLGVLSYHGSVALQTLEMIPSSYINSYTNKFN